MKLFICTTVAFVIGRSVALDGSLCPGDGFLEFNSTNGATLGLCSQQNYYCDGQYMEYNSTTGPVPANCTGIEWNITVNKTATGSISIPGVVHAAQSVFEGQWPYYLDRQRNISTPTYPLNVTSLELPDLVNAGETFTIQWADKIESLKVPKLTNITSGLFLDLTGANPPAIDLSFPSLYEVPGGIWLSGNIDSLDLSALNYTMNINITSTGNLDCIALAAKVVNATNPFYTLPYTEGGAGNNSFVCNSRKGNIATHKVIPKSGANMVEVPWGLVAVIGVAGWFGCFL